MACLCVNERQVFHSQVALYKTFQRARSGKGAKTKSLSERRIRAKKLDGQTALIYCMPLLTFSTCLSHYLYTGGAKGKESCRNELHTYEIQVRINFFFSLSLFVLNESPYLVCLKDETQVKRKWTTKREQAQQNLYKHKYMLCILLYSTQEPPTRRTKGERRRKKVDVAKKRTTMTGMTLCV